MLQEINAIPFCPSQCFLGESPLWHPVRETYFWVDIERGILFEYNKAEEKTSTWEFDYKVTLALPTHNPNELILGLNAGIGRFNLDTKKMTWLIDLEIPSKNIRCNDGGCDTKGRLWIGTMEMTLKQGAGALYCIKKDLSVSKKIEHVTISNGLAWSPDGTRLYYIDTVTYKVRSYLFNSETSAIVYERDAIAIPEKYGAPDGIAIDENCMLWIAHYGGFGIYCWNPTDGKLMDKINVPVPNVTSCAFAGKDLDHIIITTAREGLSKSALIKYPESGNIFYAKMKVKGLKKNYCTL